MEFRNISEVEERIKQVSKALGLEFILNGNSESGANGKITRVAFRCPVPGKAGTTKVPTHRQSKNVLEFQILNANTYMTVD